MARIRPVSEFELPRGVTRKEFQRVVESQRRLGVRKLLRQIEILEGRVRREFSRLCSGEEEVEDELILDLETFYTVAHDLLVLAATLLPRQQGASFKTSTGFKTISAIRTKLVRHAYDKPDGDPFNTFGWSAKDGPMLKGASPIRRFRDPGFFRNAEKLHSGLDEFDVSLLILDRHTRELLREVVRSQPAV